MNSADYRFVRISPGVEIPVPRDCSLQEEQVLIARFKAKNNLNTIEQEGKELARAIEAGELVSADEMLRTLGYASDTPERTNEGK